MLIGDVGWETWEELDVAASGGKNFGWPCNEGTHVTRAIRVPALPTATAARSHAVEPGARDRADRGLEPHRRSQSSPPGISGDAAIGGQSTAATSIPRRTAISSSTATTWALGSRFARLDGSTT